MEAKCLLFTAAVSTYQNDAMERLPGAVRDAERLRTTLTEHGCITVDAEQFWLTDGRARLKDIRNGLVRLAAIASAKDQVVLYFPLHGYRERDETGKHWIYYLLPWDATPDTARTHGISTAELGAALGRINARELVLILDCCHAGGLPDIGWLEEISDDLQSGWRSRLIIAVASGRHDAHERDEGGLFMPAFCDALEGLGVVPDRRGRIYAQQAWCHAAAEASVQAEQHGERQVAVSAGFAGPIALTTVGRQGSIPRGRWVTSYSSPQDPRFLDEVARLIPQSRRILLVGTGLRVLWTTSIKDKLIRHARRPDVQVDICLGNPYNPSVQNRLIEEEMWEHPAPVGRTGIERMFRSYVAQVVGLSEQRRVNLRLFEHYPTLATMVFDDRVFIYSYGYRELGTTSPVVALRDDDREDVRFFVDNAERVLAESVTAEDVFRARHEPKYVGPDWVAAAVFAIPDRSEPLYRAASALLGYDIRGPRAIPVSRCPVPGFRGNVGEAAEYGLHATIGDALYFATDSALERVKAELHYLAEEFEPFELTDFELVHPFHGNPAIVALQCADHSGAMEALHHELVARVYRTAISSTYRAGTTSKEAPADRRGRLMVERYGAPWILREFDPHFTLASSLVRDPVEQRAAIDGIRAALPDCFSRSAVPIKDLCLVAKKPGARRWTIMKEYRLLANSAHR